MSRQKSQEKIWWNSTLFLLSTHIAALLGLYYRPLNTIPKATLALAAIRWQIAQFGITIGYHRMYSHRAFRAGLGVRIMLAIMGTSALQGSIKWWSLRHRLHHRFTDDPVNDPYAATRGLLFSHIGWMFIKRKYERLNQMDQQDLASDPVVQFQHTYYVPLAVLTGVVLPALVGVCWNDAVGSFIYAGLVTTVINWHCTFLVNSLAHWNGLQPYSDENTSRGNLIIALLTSGEGNHNFHHTFPFDYRSEPSWLAWDPSKWVINLLWYLGLVTGLRKAPDTEIEYAIRYMQTRRDNVNCNDGESLHYWTTEEVFDYVAKDEKLCVLVINGYIIDVTNYLTTHPGGSDILRKYRVVARGTSNEAEIWKEGSWAFSGGLNNHSRMASRQLREFVLGREERGVMKREIESDVAGEESRPKRRKEGTSASLDVDVSMSAPGLNENEESGQGETESVKELGLRMWQIVKDAVNKECVFPALFDPLVFTSATLSLLQLPRGRTLSIEFLKKPSKRIYPDYYQIIQKPIALEDIKKQLDYNAYHTLEAVRADFELCFMNAKTYNLKESEIWKDAKDLLKLVNKTYEKMVPSAADAENADGDKGKSKAPSMYRMIKSRLQKLIEKSDDSGRILATEFMELPSKKEWPIYYKEIKRPQCIENIFKRIKRKEYPSAAEFAADVELVFSNALTFNQEHTLIWEDARVLRDHFRQLMTDLPAPFSLPEYSKPAPTKIKIKPQAAQGSSTATTSESHTSAPNLTLRVPALGASATKAPAHSTAASASLSVSSLPSTAAPAPQPAATTQKQVKLPQIVTQPVTTSTQTSAQTTSTYGHYPNALYHNAAAAASTSTVQKVPNVTGSQSPTPSPMSSYQLKFVSLHIQPYNRKLCLDCRDGVKSWAMRLTPAETGVLVGDITFFRDEEEESSGEEEVEQEPKQEEEDQEMDEVPVKNGRKKGKSKGKARSQKTPAKSPAKSKTPVAKKKAAKVGEVQVKLNGSVVKDEEKDGQWTVNLPAGNHVLEIGEVGGILWKVYAERLVAAA
ncbi:hypothetical protein APHAL10511_005909 [Amanita phalloides]|nr:hypothetical protein APHAL10511_005909 [Amanita phalloides]